MIRSFLCCLPIAAILLIPCHAASGQFEKGDYVIAAEKVELRVPEGKTGTVLRGNTVKIEEVNGKWLWVQGEKGSRPGWADAAKMIATDKALEFFNEQIRKNPKDAEAYYARGQQAPLFFGPGADGRTNQDALADFAQAVRLGYKPSDLYLQRAIIHATIDAEESEAAILRELNEAIRIDPNNAEAYEFRAGYWQDVGNHPRAFADLTVLVRLLPKEPSVHTSLALFRAACPEAKFREAKQALASATRACELAKWKDAAALDALAAAWAESGNFDKAVEYATKAIGATEREHQKQEFEVRLALYKEQKPYRFPPVEEEKKE